MCALSCYNYSMAIIQYENDKLNIPDFDILHKGPVRFRKMIPYERRYIEELMDTDQIAIVGIRENEAGTIHYALCIELTEDDALVSDIAGNAVKLSEEGAAEHILWFSKLDYTDPDAPEEAVRIVNKAVSFVGTDDEPLHSNNVIFTYDYYEGAPAKETDFWCVTFIWDIFRMCGLSDKFYGGRKTDSCIDILRWGIKEHRIVDIEELRYGDIAIYSWDDSGYLAHADIIICERTDGTLLTISGCTSEFDDKFSGHVNLRNRSKDDLAAVIRPGYASCSYIQYKSS